MNIHCHLLNGESVIKPIPTRRQSPGWNSELLISDLERREDRIGIWVRQGIPSNSSYSEDKIAAIGVRVKKWVAFHGIALNIDPNLDHFEGIVPCGVADHGITSLWNLGITVTTPEVDSALKINFENVFERKTTETVIV